MLGIRFGHHSIGDPRDCCQSEESHWYIKIHLLLFTLSWNMRRKDVTSQGFVHTSEETIIATSEDW